MYRTLRLRGFEYGPAFRCLERIWRRENEALGSALLRPEDRKTASSYQMHPSLLDAAFQLVAAAAETRLAGSDGSMLYLPVGVESYAVRESGTQRIWANVALRPFTSGDAGVLVADIALYSEDGARRVASVAGLQLRRLPLSALPAAVRSQIDESLYRIDWIADFILIVVLAVVSAGFFYVQKEPQTVNQAMSLINHLLTSIVNQPTELLKTVHLPTQRQETKKTLQGKTNLTAEPIVPAVQKTNKTVVC